LRDSLHEANKALNTAPERTPLARFAKRRVDAAEKTLRKRMKHASNAKRSDYASFHEVRKAGKKVRYLLEFFEPVLGKKQLKGIKRLKRLQKRFGALNDVVASEALLRDNMQRITGDGEAKGAIRSFERERKRRLDAAAKML
jgi:CHAD domain-containing protein